MVEAKATRPNAAAEGNTPTASKQGKGPMKTRLLSMIFAALLLLWSAFSFAGEYEDGLAALNRGDYKTAVAMFTKAANRGDAKAQNMLGAAYYEGRGVPQDYKQAALWYRKAANQGNAGAQYELGLAYERGRGVPQDYKQAVSWYRKAADQGDAEAQNNLGVAYATGQGVRQDYKQAVLWHRKAAEQGLAQAQNSLGRAYATGQGVPQDYIEGYKWLSVAAANSTDKDVRDNATTNRDILAKKMTSAQIAEAQKRAKKWKKK